MSLLQSCPFTYGLTSICMLNHAVNSGSILTDTSFKPHLLRKLFNTWLNCPRAETLKQGLGQAFNPASNTKHSSMSLQKA